MPCLRHCEVPGVLHLVQLFIPIRSSWVSLLFCVFFSLEAHQSQLGVIFCERPFQKIAHIYIQGFDHSIVPKSRV